MPDEPRTYEKPPVPSQYNVGELFGPSMLWVIPSWQREYSWQCGEGREVDLLLSDMAEFVAKKDRKNYLLGSIITYADGNGRVVVDGQQRTVTLYILLCALQTSLIQATSAEYGDEEVPRWIKNIVQSVGQCTLHTNAQESSLPVSMRHAKGDLVLKMISEDTPDEIEEPTQSQERILEAYEHCKEYLSKQYVGAEALAEFARGLLLGVFIVDISAGDLRQALEVFIKLNLRGRDLEDADLVKNYLFQVIDNEDQFDSISSTWADMTRALRSSAGKPKLKTAEFFLRTWAILRKGTKLEGELPVWEYWESQIEDPKERSRFLADAVSMASRFADVVDGKHPKTHKDNPTQRGSRYVGGSQYLPVLLAGAHLSEACYLHLSELVNARYLLYTLSLERTQDFETLMPAWSKAIAELPPNASSKDVDVATRASGICLGAREVANVRSFVQALTYSKQRRKLRVILAMTAKHYQQIVKEDDLDLSGYLLGYNSKKKKGFDLDHIAAQASFKNEKAGSERHTLLDGLGNLVLISGKQREYLDKKPSEKASLYRGGKVLSKALVEPAIDEEPITADLLRKLRNNCPVDLSSWKDKEVAARRDFLIGEFLGLLPDALFEPGSR